MGIETAAAFGADAAPLAQQQGMAEQVGPDFETVDAPFVPLGPDADQYGRLGEQRELDGSRGADFAAFGRLHTGSVSRPGRFGRRGRAFIPGNPSGRGFGRASA